MKNLAKQQKGFTIIEVLIVLAIAGLIILIVFLAVPALQRNSRNTQRREDVARIQGAMNETATNYNWNLFGLIGDSFPNMGDMSIYKNKAWNSGDYLLDFGANKAADSDINKVKVVFQAACSGETTTVDKNHSIAVLYRVETGNGSAVQCD